MAIGDSVIILIFQQIVFLLIFVLDFRLSQGVFLPKKTMFLLKSCTEYTFTLRPCMCYFIA